MVLKTSKKKHSNPLITTGLRHFSFKTTNCTRLNKKQVDNISLFFFCRFTDKICVISILQLNLFTHETLIKKVQNATNGKTKEDNYLTQVLTENTKKNFGDDINQQSLFYDCG